MTPLAAYLVKQTIARPKHREGVWRDPQVIPNLRGLLEDIHCFEITACFDLIWDMVRQRGLDRTFETFGFLPAPKTWIEWKLIDGGGRRAVCLTQHPDQMLDKGLMRDYCTVTLLEPQNAMHAGWLVPSTGGFMENDDPSMQWPPRSERPPAESLIAMSQVAMVLINTPKIIGRRQHMPNAALERNLTRGFGAGKFPLHAWTEILLQVSKPIEIDDGEEHEAHLTGRRALHFCRKHIRIRRGELEYVSAHWRGDPALGIKRSRYTVSA